MNVVFILQISTLLTLCVLRGHLGTCHKRTNLSEVLFRQPMLRQQISRGLLRLHFYMQIFHLVNHQPLFSNQFTQAAHVHSQPSSLSLDQGMEAQVVVQMLKHGIIMWFLSER